MRDNKCYRETEFFWEVQQKNVLRDMEQVHTDVDCQLGLPRQAWFSFNFWKSTPTP